MYKLNTFLKKSFSFIGHLLQMTIHKYCNLKFKHSTINVLLNANILFSGINTYTYLAVQLY